MISDPTTNGVMTPKDLARRLGISERSVREKVYAGLWPCLRLDSRTLRFEESDYEAILAMSRRRPQTPIGKANGAQDKEDLVRLLTSGRAS